MNAKIFRLILLRHGNTFNDNEIPYQIGCKTDLALTAKGIAQAQAFSSYLQRHDRKPSAIYCGSLQRQYQTAHLLKEQFPATPLFTHTTALDEIDYGTWEKLTTEEIQTKWPQAFEQWQHQGIWPAQFSQDKQYHLNLLQQWIISLEEIASNGELIIAVSSNGLLRLMLYFIPALWEKVASQKKMNEYKVSTGNYCEFEFRDSVPSILSWNTRS